jgi:hypothetical protein
MGLESDSALVTRYHLGFIPPLSRPEPQPNYHKLTTTATVLHGRNQLSTIARNSPEYMTVTSRYSIRTNRLDRSITLAPSVIHPEPSGTLDDDLQT